MFASTQAECSGHGSKWIKRAIPYCMCTGQCIYLAHADMFTSPLHPLGINSAAQQASRRQQNATIMSPTMAKPPFLPINSCSTQQATAVMPPAQVPC
mmetsp:Transcript_138979/g.241683  ORF Transcript_138979/g.241683 Transcript_138979/m.241683 type:complete len:97 (-) Transcript_138979:163-453(-)